nr:MAG TPA: Protein of unknown function (DUF722) [Caudoviricetes sp.]
MYNNDYENIIKKYLRNYITWRTYLDNLQIRIEDLASRLKLEAAPKCTKFEFTGGGGWETLSPEEAAAIQHEKDEAVLKRLKSDFSQYNSVIKCLDKCIGELNQVEQDVINQRGINGENWAAVSMRNSMSESNCRACFKRAVRKITGMYFGPAAYPEQGSLFLPGGNLYISLQDKKIN